MLPAFSRAQSYPGKDISWIVSSEPGGGFDTYARAVSPYLEKYLPSKVNVVVKNITGGGGLKGASSIFNAKPDGYTIGYIYYPGIAIIQMTSDIGFDFTRLTPIAQIAVDIQGLFVSAKSDIKTLADLQKKNPLRILTQPKGVTMYSFCTIAGKVLNLKYKLVTGYKGGNEVATGIMRGDGDAGVLNLSEFIKYVKSEDLRVILTFSEKRDTLTPNVPSVKELGFPEATAINSWKVLFGPPSLPPDITKTLQTAFQKALEDPGLKAWADKAERALEFKDGESSWKELQTIVPIYKKYE
jgi:tripartite-type tricarboxylate transporter receptor subunit TctC